ncbi:MAG: glycerophosphoryl diester phosphodiesterase membrane domain-containing protein [Gemmatimonadales bacterium]
MAAPALRPLTLGEVLDVSFGLFRSLFMPLLMVTLLTQSVPLAISVYIEARGGILANVPLWGFNALANSVLAAIASAACTFIIAENYLGRRLSARDALSRAMPYTGRLVMVALLSSFIIFIGFLLVIVPGVILGVGLVLATPAMVLEGIPAATDALGRSWSLTRGYRFKLFVALLVVILLVFLPVMALAGFTAATFPRTPEAVAASAGSPTALVITATTAVLQVLITPLLYCLLTVSYYDLRVRKEAFDLEVLASSLASA